MSLKTEQVCSKSVCVYICVVTDSDSAANMLKVKTMPCYWVVSEESDRLSIPADHQQEAVNAASIRRGRRAVCVQLKQNHVGSRWRPFFWPFT